MDSSRTNDSTSSNDSADIVGGSSSSDGGESADIDPDYRIEIDNVDNDAPTRTPTPEANEQTPGNSEAGAIPQPPPRCPLNYGPFLDILALLGAGGTCLLLDGFAMFRWLVEDPLIDWRHGGQPLHLVYRAERFLAALLDRGADIYMFFFEEEAQFLALHSARYLAFVSLFEHLRSNSRACGRHLQVKALPGLSYDAGAIEELVMALRPRCVLTGNYHSARSRALIYHLRSLAQMVVGLETLDLNSPRVLGCLVQETRPQKQLTERAEALLCYCRLLDRPPAAKGATTSLLAALGFHASQGGFSPRVVVGMAAVGELRQAGSRVRPYAAVYCVALAFSELVAIRARSVRDDELAAEPSADAARGVSQLQQVLAKALRAVVLVAAVPSDATLSDTFDGRLFFHVVGLVLAGFDSTQRGGLGGQTCERAHVTGRSWRRFLSEAVADLAEELWCRSQLPSKASLTASEEICLGDALQGLLGREDSYDAPAAYASWPRWGQYLERKDEMAAAASSDLSRPCPSTVSAQSLIQQLLEEGETANSENPSLNTFEPQHFHGLNALEVDAGVTLRKRYYRVETHDELQELLAVLQTSGKVQLIRTRKYSSHLRRHLSQRWVVFCLHSFTDRYSSDVPVSSKLELVQLVSANQFFPILVGFVMDVDSEADMRRTQKGAARQMKFIESLLHGTSVNLRPILISKLWEPAELLAMTCAARDRLKSTVPETEKRLVRGREAKANDVDAKAKHPSRTKEKPASKTDQLKQRVAADRASKNSKQHLQAVTEFESRWKAMGAKDTQGRLLELQTLLGRVREYWLADSTDASLKGCKLALKVAQDLDQRSPVNVTQRKQTFQVLQEVLRVVGGPSSLAACGDPGQEVLRSAVKVARKLQFTSLEAALETAMAPVAASRANTSSSSRSQGGSVAAITAAGLASPGDGTTCPIVFQLAIAPEHLARPRGKADSRVQGFDPDGWQRTLLDVADAQQSALVLAPTASGKTFISFYVMERVLRASDEGVVVYICPTNALANQVYGEVQARYSKTYKSKGQMVAGIFTRDFGEHTSSCQVLVTVPQCFLILLLSPTLESVDWCQRLRYAILDEIHTLGTEGGAIWEQVLLVLNCPLLALSATLGAPDAFVAWLRGLEQSRGRELVVVQHHGRYNHLAPWIFDGVTLERIHPYLALLDGTGEHVLPRPPALTMLPEDAVRLHELLVELEGATPPLTALAPSTFFAAYQDAFWDLSMEQASEWERAVAKHFDALPPERRLEVVLRLTEEARKGFRVVEQALPERDETHIYGPLLADLFKSSQFLPAICFHSSRTGCEQIAVALFEILEKGEKRHRQDGRMENEKRELEAKLAGIADRLSQISTTTSDPKLETLKTEHEGIQRAIAFLDEPLMEFTVFVPGQPRLLREALHEDLSTLRVRPSGGLWPLLSRGIGVHHAGLSKEYRQTVERMFRMRQLGFIVSTSTLAVGINMPSKASIFAGDSPTLNAYQYQQEAGRAGRRGFDLRGHTVFLGLPQQKVSLLLGADLPMIQGNEVLTPSLVLRLVMKERFLAAKHLDRSDILKAIERVIGYPMFLPRGDMSKLQRAALFRLCCSFFREQRLLGPRLELMDLAGFVIHIHYDEPGNFALASLLQEPDLLEGICRQSREALVTLLCHLFCRRPGEDPWKVPSTTLPPLPGVVCQKLADLSQRILKSSVTFWRDFLSAHASMYASEVLPLTNLQVHTRKVELREGQAIEVARRHAPRVNLRSSFDALSGWNDDDFECIEDLCSSARWDLGLTPNMFPAFSELSPNLNSYLLDYYKHHQICAIIKHNRVPHTEIYQLFDNFHFMLKALAATSERRSAATVNRPTSFSDPLLVSTFSAVSKEFEASVQFLAGPWAYRK